MNRKAKLIRLIHIAKSQIYMSDNDYRCLLANVSCGKTSSKDCTVEQLETVLQHMKANGFEVMVTQRGQGEPIADLGEQMRKIRALWLELYQMGVVRVAAESALHRYCAKYGGEDWQENGAAMSRIIERLKQWRSRF